MRVTALLIGTEKFAALLYPLAAALRAFLSGRFLPGREITFPDYSHSRNNVCPFRLFDHNILAALRTGHSGLFRYGLVFLQSGNPGRAKEFAMGPYLTTMLRLQIIADHTRNFIGDFHRLQSLLRSGTASSNRIEVLDDRFPFYGSVCHLV